MNFLTACSVSGACPIRTSKRQRFHQRTRRRVLRQFHVPSLPLQESLPFLANYRFGIGDENLRRRSEQQLPYAQWLMLWSVVTVFHGAIHAVRFVKASCPSVAQFPPLIVGGAL